MSWDSEHLRILRELGHEPMLLADSMGGTGVVGAASSRDSGVPVAEGQSRPKAAPAVAGAVLAAAIARAAGGRDLSALALDLERLRLEPALKRALWPQLRALRRGH